MGKVTEGDGSIFPIPLPFATRYSIDAYDCSITYYMSMYLAAPDLQWSASNANGASAPCVHPSTIHPHVSSQLSTAETPETTAHRRRPGPPRHTTRCRCMWVIPCTVPRVPASTTLQGRPALVLSRRGKRRPWDGGGGGGGDPWW